MSDTTDARKKYLDGYNAFERGNFEQAETLADACLSLSSQDSYWYAGALGLKCWIASFTDNPALAKTAETLLAMDTGNDQPWFDGVALLNLGLASQRQGEIEQARQFFLRAAKRYKAQKLQPGQPDEWRYVIYYFATLCQWAGGGDTGEWEEFIARLEDDSSKENELLQELDVCAQLMRRHALGDNVKHEAVESVKKGISRTFLSILLIE